MQGKASFNLRNLKSISYFKIMATFSVTIDGKKTTLTSKGYHNGAMQYNTPNNASAHNFTNVLGFYPKETPIKTNGCIYIIHKEL